MVPVEALISADVHNGSVYIVRNGIAHVQEVKVDKMGDSLLISRGLNAGDNVIIEGLQNVSGDSIPVNSK